MGKTDSIQVPIVTGEPQDYEADFYGWSMEQSSRLRLLRIPGLDTENLAEEIESLGRNDKRELANRSEVLLIHLLKWTYQPTLRGRGWRVTVHEQRRKIESLLEESPRCLVPECHDAILTREAEEALWQAVFTVQPEQRREFEPSSKRRKRRAAPWPNATD